jgi:hypothetical protein
MCPLEMSEAQAQGAPDVSGAPEAHEGHGPQVLASGVDSNDETPIAEIVLEADTTTVASIATSSTMGEAAVGGPQP